MTVEDIDRIFDAMAPQKRASFDRAYIEKLYLEYMERNAGDSSLEELRQALAGKRALVVAPGKKRQGGAGENRGLCRQRGRGLHWGEL